MEWDGKRFPVAKWNPGENAGEILVPEAYEASVCILPHEHLDLDCVFPRAIAADTLGDQDPLEENSWELRGVGIGRELGRGRRKV